MQFSNNRIPIVVILFAAVAAVGQQSGSPTAAGNNSGQQGPTTVRGCLSRSRGNYLVIENQSNLVYVLKGVGRKLDSQLHHEVEVKGRVLPGTIKTGIRAEKAGSNPSDTVHGVDGLPLQVADVADVHTIAQRCKAADQQ